MWKTFWETTMASLTEYLKGKKPGRFQPHPHYSPEGDCLIFYFRNEDSYRKRIDNFVTVYLSMDKNELVGCQIKGVHRLLERMGSFGVAIKNKKGEVELGLLFLACMAYSD